MSFFSVDSNRRLTWTGDGETIVVEAWGTNAVRVRARQGGPIVDHEWALLPQANQSVTSVEIDDATARLTQGSLTVELEARQGRDYQAGYTTSSCVLTFRNAENEVLFRELRSGGALKLKARDYRAHVGGDHRITASFEAHADEHLVGMGLYQQDVADLKGSVLELMHRNSQASVPFVVSSKGYGFLWHNPAIGRVAFGRNRTEWIAESAQQLDYWITVGDTPADIASAYADATGHPPMMPEYGLGFWQCKLRYWNQEQLLGVAREHKRRGLPLDVIVADFFHWPHMGDYRFDDEFWPDPMAMSAELEELGVKLAVSVWPQVSVRSENFERFQRENLLVQADRGLATQMAFEEPCLFLDVTNPAARSAVWELCERNYHEKGVRIFWLDEAEPEYGVYDIDNYRYYAGSGQQVSNVFPQQFSRAFFEGMQGVGQNDIVNLVRCAWAGSQRYGALVWSGDIGSTWTDLRHQIAAGIHIGAAGIPWFTTDIGGFHGGDINDPAFHELLVRWFQFGAFSPVFRLHGDRQPSELLTAADGSRRLASGAPNELWSYGEDVYQILSRYMQLRERMRPYIRDLMKQAHESGQPVMRGLFHEFPQDVHAWDVADQYLLGPDLLVAPVIEPGATTRTVYLPAGASWIDLRSHRKFAGGNTVTVDAPLDVLPLFGREGGVHDVGRCISYGG